MHRESTFFIQKTGREHLILHIILNSVFSGQKKAYIRCT